MPDNLKKFGLLGLTGFLPFAFISAGAAKLAGAVLAHVFEIGRSAVPALVLGTNAAVTVHGYREQIPARL